MELTGERTIAAPRDVTWAALNDPETLKACIAGCETLEKTGDDAYVAVVAMKVGPVSARFRGNLRMTEVVPPTSYTLVFDGQGGVAGFGKGTAAVSLAEAGPQATTLSYVARASVGGKLAQIGSRLIDAAAGKVANDFFAAFERVLRERMPQAEAATAASSPASPPVQPLAPTQAVAAPAPARAPASTGSRPTTGDPMLAALAGAAARQRGPVLPGPFDWLLAGAVVAVTAVVALVF